MEIDPVVIRDLRLCGILFYQFCGNIANLAAGKAALFRNIAILGDVPGISFSLEDILINHQGIGGRGKALPILVIYADDRILRGYLETYFVTCAFMHQDGVGPCGGISLFCQGRIRIGVCL